MAHAQLQGPKDHIDGGGPLGLVLGGKAQVQDNKWTKIEDVHEQHVQDLGEFAVKEQNEKENWILEFEKVTKGWTQHHHSVRPGIIYRLHIKAELQGTSSDFEAQVFKMYDGSKELLSFTEL